MGWEGDVRGLTAPKVPLGLYMNLPAIDGEINSGNFRRSAL